MNLKLSTPKYDKFIAKAVYYQEYMASQFWSPFSMTRQYHLPEVRDKPWWLDHSYFQPYEIER